MISGTLNNQATIDATADYLDITGVYQAQGGTISGSGYPVNCQLQETAAPASPSTIVVAGNAVTLATDNLAGYTLWVQGSDHGGNAVLQLGGSLANRGTILLQSANNTYQSEINTGSSTLTNLGTISSGAGSGGLRVISGTLNNQATIDATADYLDITGVYQAGRRDQRFWLPGQLPAPGDGSARRLRQPSWSRAAGSPWRPTTWPATPSGCRAATTAATPSCSLAATSTTPAPFFSSRSTTLTSLISPTAHTR